MANLPFLPSRVPQRYPTGQMLALALAFGAALWTGKEFAQDWRATLPPQPARLSLRAAQPENGGWLGEEMRVMAGQPVRLSVAGVEGSHAFAIGHTDIASGLILPGQAQVVEFIAPAPGRYVLYCTQWCSPDHWRMRTVLEVVDPKNPDAGLVYAQEPPRYPLPLAQMDIDAPHPAPVWPQEQPSGAAGAALWQARWPALSARQIGAELGWPLASPAEVYRRLSTADDSPLAGAAGLSARERWAVVAHLWQAQTTPQSLALGAALYRQNCASCHGERGAGDGFAAAFAPVAVPDFTDPVAASGASPALYYAKMARGGMGTGMPNWGTIFRENELWALVDYLYTFLFDGSQ